MNGEAGRSEEAIEEDKERKGDRDVGMRERPERRPSE
jgi:hypothetical protein